MQISIYIYRVKCYNCENAKEMARDEETPRKIISRTLIFCAFLFFLYKNINLWRKRIWRDKMIGDFLSELSDYLHDINTVSTAFRIFLAMITGGILGLEREIKNRPAGLRTYMLVCIGAAMVMITNQYICETFVEFDVDPARMGAQVISGIGFLGAGTIIVTRRNQVKGLTTAAGLWAAACLGLAIGIGFYSGAIIGGIGVLFSMMGLHRLDKRIQKNARLIDLYIEFKNIANVSSFIAFVRKNNFDIKDTLIDKGQLQYNETTSLIITLKSPFKQDHSSIIQLLSQAEGIQYIEIL